MTEAETLAAIQAALDSANFAEAETLCEAALAQFAKPAQIQAYWGYACHLAGKPESAIDHCNSALSEDTSFWFAHHVRGMARTASNVPTRGPSATLAIRLTASTLRRQLEVAVAASGSAAAFKAYATAPAELRVEVPLEEVEHIVQRVSTGAAFADLAAVRARLNQGDAAGAEILARQSLKRFFDVGELHGLLAYALQQQGRTEEAIAASAAATDLSAGDWLALHARGTALRSLGRVAEARAAFARAVKEFPADVSMRTNLFETTLQSRGFDAARLVMESAPADFANEALRQTWRTLLVENGEPDIAPVGTTTVVSRIETARAWAERNGIAVVESGPEEQVPITPLRIWGEGEPSPPINVASYKTYAVELPDATIASRSSLVLTSDDCVLNDVGADSRYGHFVSWAYDKRVIAQSGRTVMVDRATYAPIEIEGGIMLSGLASDAFGHWIPEYLCRLPTLERHPAFGDLPIIVDADMPTSQLDYLQLLCDRPVLTLPAGAAFRCRRLLYAPPPTFFPVELVANNTIPEQQRGMLSPAALRILRERVVAKMVSNHAAPSHSGRGRWFLGRRNLRWRRLSNEAEIETALQARGFETVYTEDMTFAQQVTLFRNADAIVAPNGSSLLNLIFAPTELPIVVLGQHNAFNWGGFQGPMEELGYKPLWVCSTDASLSKHADYSIEPAAVMSALESLGIR
jgi:tetratricopeptide (TPR) repeat protein